MAQNEFAFKSLLTTFRRQKQKLCNKQHTELCRMATARVLSCHCCEPRSRFASLDKVFMCIAAWRKHKNKVFILLLSRTKFIELVFKVLFRTSHKTLLYFTLLYFTLLYFTLLYFTLLYNDQPVDANQEK